MTQLTLFDYSRLDIDTRAFVETRTSEIKTLVKRSAQDIIEIGQKLTEVKARLGHGNFGAWLEAEFEWSESAAQKLMSVAHKFKNVNFTDLSIAPSALYMLAAPSTPDEAVDEAMQRAQNGERITYNAAKEIMSQYRESAPNHVNIVDEWGEVETVEIPSGHRFVYEFEPEEPGDEPLTETANFAFEWTESQLERRRYIEQGMTQIANMKTDWALIEWAKEHDLFVRIDRTTQWGNPFILPADGERLILIENYQWYLEHKPSLLAKLETLKGKVLGCWCYPEMCHGEVLEEYADDRAD